MPGKCGIEFAWGYQVPRIEMKPIYEGHLYDDDGELEFLDDVLSIFADLRDLVEEEEETSSGQYPPECGWCCEDDCWFCEEGFEILEYELGEAQPMPN